MYKCGKSDLFALIISLKYLLSEDDFNTFCCKIYDRIFILKKYLHTRNIDDIFKIMNFPNNWKDIKKHNANLKIQVLSNILYNFYKVLLSKSNKYFTPNMIYNNIIHIQTMKVGYI